MKSVFSYSSIGIQKYKITNEANNTRVISEKQQKKWFSFLNGYYSVAVIINRDFLICFVVEI